MFCGYEQTTSSTQQQRNGQATLNALIETKTSVPFNVRLGMVTRYSALLLRYSIFSMQYPYTHLNRSGLLIDCIHRLGQKGNDSITLASVSLFLRFG